MNPHVRLLISLWSECPKGAEKLHFQHSYRRTYFLFKLLNCKKTCVALINKVPKVFKRLSCSHFAFAQS